MALLGVAVQRAHVRVLLVADTHIGFDDPLRPRVERRRRGPDFLRSFECALEPALRGEVDLVVHGGDLLHRSRSPAGLVQCALAPLLRVAERGVPVFVIPGNHERSRIPFGLLAYHPRVHVFQSPGTFTETVRGLRVAVSGVPFARDVSAPAFSDLVERTSWRAHDADVRVLGLHQAVEGAKVGVHDHTFRCGRDVVAGHALPPGFAAVLAGHIHRSQVLTHDLARRSLAAPVLYPGATERTSFVEREEVKGYLLLDLGPASGGGRLLRWTFVRLPARPMVVLGIDVTGRSRERLAASLRGRLAALDPHAVVRWDVEGTPVPGADGVLSARSLRRLAPPTMNVEVSRAAH